LPTRTPESSSSEDASDASSSEDAASSSEDAAAAAAAAPPEPTAATASRRRSAAALSPVRTLPLPFGAAAAAFFAPAAACFAAALPGLCRGPLRLEPSSRMSLMSLWSNPVFRRRGRHARQHRVACSSAPHHTPWRAMVGLDVGRLTGYAMIQGVP
jgi:hypothetical protein